MRCQGVIQGSIVRSHILAKSYFLFPTFPLRNLAAVYVHCAFCEGGGDTRTQASLHAYLCEDIHRHNEFNVTFSLII